MRSCVKLLLVLLLLMLSLLLFAIGIIATAVAVVFQFHRFLSTLFFVLNSENIMKA